MNFGSITIVNNNDNNYKICSTNDSQLFSFFINSLQLPFENMFFANNVCSLSHFIQTNNFSIKTAYLLLSSLFNQLHILEQYKITISFLDINDILVIDDLFFICNIDKFYKYQDNRILITVVYDKNNPYLSPLFKSNTYIPFYSHKNDFFYNLALIVLNCLRKTNFLLSELSTQQLLEYYDYTKIYQTLKFCLNNDVTKRQFIIF